MRVSTRVCLLFLCTHLLQSPLFANVESIANESFSDLVKSQATLSDDAAISASESLWKKYQQRSREDVERLRQHTDRALTFADKTMKFSLEKRGEPGPGGFPVYIALHGGGGAPPYVNDSQWQHMKIYYRDSVKSGIYIAPRGVTDTWNLHFRDESYPLYDHLIENLIAYEGADPNRIYLLGFSAGGDGVYQVVPRMADRWAAANMSAGHHNWIKFDNLLNTPFLIQVGERDGAYKRNRVGAENWLQLQELHKQYSGYTSQVFIHANYGHNGWPDNDPSNRQGTVLKNPAGWLASGDRSTYQTDTNAVRWLKQWERSTQPKKLIWDLSTRAQRPQSWGAQYIDDASSLRPMKDLFYWLAVDTADLTKGRLEIEQFPAENAIRILKAEGVRDFKILLQKGRFDFTKPVKVFMGDSKIAELKPEIQVSVMTRTLLERGDRNFMYHAEIPVHLENVQESFEINEAQDPASELFSYCSEGQCRMMSAERWHQVRGFPLDMHYKCKKDNQYALTFDDGPSAANADQLLALLARHGAKATFFVVGGGLKSQAGKDVIRRYHANGHQIANHSMTHSSLPNLRTEQIVQEVKGTQDLIVEALGNDARVLRDSAVVRPPFGNMSQRVQDVLKSIGFSSVRWNADRYDWKLKLSDRDLLLRRHAQQFEFIDLQSTNFNHSILDLNHETSALTLSVLDEVLPKIKAKGYEFVTVSECIGLAN